MLSSEPTCVQRAARNNAQHKNTCEPNEYVLNAQTKREKLPAFGSRRVMMLKYGYGYEYKRTRVQTYISFYPDRHFSAWWFWLEFKAIWKDVSPIKESYVNEILLMFLFSIMTINIQVCNCINASYFTQQTITYTIYSLTFKTDILPISTWNILSMKQSLSLNLIFCNFKSLCRIDKTNSTQNVWSVINYNII